MKLIIALSSVDERRLLEYSFHFDTTTEIIGSCSTGEEVLNLCRISMPDVLVADSVLEDCNCIDLIKKLKKYSEKTKIIIVAPQKNEKLVKKAINLGVDYIMIKPYEISTMKKRINYMLGTGNFENADMPNSSNIESRMETLISNILNSTGIMPNLKGYHYIKSALLIGFKNEMVLKKGITKGIYPEIAKENNTSTIRVERAIRHAIESAWKRYGKNDYYKNLGFMVFNDEKRPTNSEFIYTISEYLRSHTEQ